MEREDINTIVAVLAFAVAGGSLGWQILDSIESKREAVRVIDVGLDARPDTSQVMLRWGVDLINMGQRSIYVRRIEPLGSAQETGAQFARLGIAFPLDSASRLPLVPGEARRFLSSQFPSSGHFINTPHVAALLVTTTRDRHVVRVEPSEIGLHFGSAELRGVVFQAFTRTGMSVLEVDPADVEVAEANIPRVPRM